MTFATGRFGGNVPDAGGRDVKSILMECIVMSVSKIVIYEMWILSRNQGRDFKYLNAGFWKTTTS